MRKCFEKIKLCTARGTDPAGRKKIVAASLNLHVRNILKSLIAAGKSAIASNLRVGLAALFARERRRKPWRTLIEINPADTVDLDRQLPPDFKDYCDRSLSESEIAKLCDRFQSICTAFESRTGSRCSLATPLPREYELAVWLILSMPARINEICTTPWENVNLEQATRLIPADQAKNRRALTVQFSARLWRELHTLTGHTPWLLPGATSRLPLACCGPVINTAASGKCATRGSGSGATSGCDH